MKHRIDNKLCLNYQLVMLQNKLFKHLPAVESSISDQIIESAKEDDQWYLKYINLLVEKYPRLMGNTLYSISQFDIEKEEQRKIMELVLGVITMIDQTLSQNKSVMQDIELNAQEPIKLEELTDIPLEEHDPEIIKFMEGMKEHGIDEEVILKAKKVSDHLLSKLNQSQTEPPEKQKQFQSGKILPIGGEDVHDVQLEANVKHELDTTYGNLLESTAQSNPDIKSGRPSTTYQGGIIIGPNTKTAFGVSIRANQ